MPDPNANPVNGTNIACVEMADVISRVESTDFIGAIRYEPLVFADHHFNYSQIANAKDANHCNERTARLILSCSWGAYQIMGFNLYERTACDYHGSIADFLASKLAQRMALKKLLDSDHLGYTPAELLDTNKRNHFAEKYNGPGNIADYSAKLLRALNDLGLK